MSIPIPTEEQEQKAFFRWVDFIIGTGSMPELKTIFAIPNSGPGSQRGQAGKMKALGMRKGVCDVFWPLARGGYHGLFLELKRQRSGRVTPEQREFMELVSSAGYLAVVAKGNLEAQDIILSYHGGNNV